MTGTYKTKSFKQRDIRFLTEKDGLIGSKILCIGGDESSVFVGTDKGLSIISGGSCSAFPCDGVKCIYTHKDGVIYFACGKVLYTYEKGETKEFASFDENIEGIDGDEKIFAVTKGNIYELRDGRAEWFFDNWRECRGVSVAGDKIREYATDSIMIFPGKRKHWRCIISEHSDMPSFKVNTIKFDRETGFLYIGTNMGLYIYDDHTGWYGHRQLNALPEEEIFSIDIKNGVIALGSVCGAIVIRGGVTKYLPATRYTPTEKVNCVKIIGNELWCGTNEGISVISEKEMTLEEKSDYFYSLANKYYFRRGFVVGLAGCRNSLEEGTPHISDNDGLWTHMYLSSLCYRYAVTKDEKILENARKSLEAMLYLTKVSGIKGFVARAVRFEGDRDFGKGLDMAIDGSEWHKSPVYDCEWLGETSSDEMTGHYLGFSLYYDLCANEEEKEKIREAVCDITDHIIDHGYRLYDCDNLPTTWACWAPEELNHNNMWLWEKCVNSLEILTFLKVAYHMSGNEKYLKEWRRLAYDNHYLLNCAQHKKEDGHECHIDDNLAMMCALTLLRLEENESIRAYILMGLKHHFDYERQEHMAMWLLIYGAFIDAPCDIDTAVKYLEDMPLSPIMKRMLNSKRKNLVFNKDGALWGNRGQLDEPLAIDERAYGTYSDNPFTVDSGRGEGANNPSTFLLPYWFARYYGLID